VGHKIFLTAAEKLKKELEEKAKAGPEEQEEEGQQEDGQGQEEDVKWEENITEWNWPEGGQDEEQPQPKAKSPASNPSEEAEGANQDSQSPETSNLRIAATEKLITPVEKQEKKVRG
jgi:hypothetical protein